MSPEEQRAFVTHLRTLRTSPQSFARAIRIDQPKKTKAVKEPTTKSVDLLAGEYGV